MLQYEVEFFTIEECPTEYNISDSDDDGIVNQDNDDKFQLIVFYAKMFFHANDSVFNL